SASWNVHPSMVGGSASRSFGHCCTRWPSGCRRSCYGFYEGVRGVDTSAAETIRNLLRSAGTLGSRDLHRAVHLCRALQSCSQKASSSRPTTDPSYHRGDARPLHKIPRNPLLPPELARLPYCPLLSHPIQQTVLPHRN